MDGTPIKVLIVDDSALVRNVLERIFTSSVDVDVVGLAANGHEALEAIAMHDPAVVCTDLYMPGMDGLQLTKRIMAECPRPILVVSSAVGEQHADNVFELLNAGAVDVFPKPKGGGVGEYDEVAQELVRKVRVLAGVRVIRKARPPRPRAKITTTTATDKPRVTPSIVVVGASTGGPQAYRSILSALPEDFPAPLLCVQHIGDGFLRSLVKWLNSTCVVTVKVAEHGERAVAGTAYFAPDGMHLEVASSGRLMTTHHVPFEGHRPSITCLFESAARSFQNTAVGVLLTGMGRDGADGLHSIVKAGGITIAQDEESCVVFGMPQRAIELNAARSILPLEQIARKLVWECGGPPKP